MKIYLATHSDFFHTTCVSMVAFGWVKFTRPTAKITTGFLANLGEEISLMPKEQMTQFRHV